MLKAFVSGIPGVSVKDRLPTVSVLDTLVIESGLFPVTKGSLGLPVRNLFPMVDFPVPEQPMAIKETRLLLVMDR